MRKLTLTLLAAMALPLAAAAQGTVSLDSCRRMAINNNKEVQNTQLEIEKAGYQRKVAKAAYLPTFDLEGTYTYNSRKLSLISEDALLPMKTFNPATGTYDFALAQDASTGLPLTANGSVIPSNVALLPKSSLTYDVHNVFAGAVTMTQPVYMGGKIRAMNEITRFAEELAQQQHDTKVQDVVYNVDEAYWQVVSLQAKKKLVDSYLKLVTNLQSDVAKMVQQGVATKAMQLNVDVKVNEANVNLTKVDNGLELSRMHLNQICGQPINRTYKLADEDRDILESGTLHSSDFNMDSVYANRHEIRSLELATKIYDQKIKVAKAEMLPSVAAMAAYHVMNPNTYDGYKNEFGFAFTAGLVVKVPLWHWGGLSNKVKIAQVEAREQEVKLNDAKDKIRLQVNQAAFRYQEAWKTYEKTRSNLTSANENLRCANIGFKEGVVNLDNVLTAQTAWFKAYSDNIDAQIDIQLCDVYLSKVLGTMRY